MGTRTARWLLAGAAIWLAASTGTAQEVRTIRPGMTFDEVKSVFGEPAGVRNFDNHTFYFYQNGVEREYGTADIVFFMDGQVVDAVLRSSRRAYAGESSSPMGTEPRPTPGGTRLDLPGDVESVEVRPAPAPSPEEEPRPQPETQPEAMEEPTAEAEEAMGQPTVEAEEPMSVELLEAFEDFLPVCIEVFRESGMIQGRDAQPLCECTAAESQMAGVEEETIEAITEALRTDPSALSQDARVQAAGTRCVDRMMEGGGAAGADTSGNGG
ncbi:MAG: outer membrane protein assembly factor BamE [Gemmatimonadetes bacterium]|uniref:Outer membrane protein assembly factor BamE n=1 Tax=Candidatus Kutchimonas denitrificans TaxID=3056748 RepID=A0AAE5CAH0_9BACT|nr:outer membrane protein assembly factor BamE [Gemmatimonadota bacterium]NIR74597.1 outer membrane protein assembly factor BamE [Candidatus Kutchimonas denitrificans]NIS02787.1 outer membrane protein assembly factor BamE [Gemmatimonadota bacterium]NIT68948.1 outer membrane protein assembly factor BamE [Gemmatimonadota bacterium]NIU52253.1 outer membrane protein assembly factor BamE [Gemmatimonadota bacterium]